jgi:hypothetical protein
MIHKIKVNGYYDKKKIKLHDLNMLSQKTPPFFLFCSINFYFMNHWNLLYRFF